MKKPIVVEMFADNGDHSHYQLVDLETGSLIWSEDVEDYKYVSNESHISNACMYYRHDFGLMTDKEKEILKHQCKMWVIALSKAMQDNNKAT